MACSPAAPTGTRGAPPCVTTRSDCPLTTYNRPAVAVETMPATNATRLLRQLVQLLLEAIDILGSLEAPVHEAHDPLLIDDERGGHLRQVVLAGDRARRVEQHRQRDTELLDHALGV